MPHYQYLILGGGMTGDAAISGIRELDANGTIGLISAEPDPPYNRPPLSKGLWKGKPFKTIFRKGKDQGVDLHLGTTVRSLDPRKKQLTDAQGTTYTYDKLLLATGGTPRRLPFGGDDILYYRTVRDYQRLKGLTEKSKRFAVIGGGFIGTEIAAALTMQGKEVIMFLMESEIGELVYPADLAQFLTSYYAEKGVEVLTREQITSFERSGEQFTLNTKSGRSVTVDAVVAGIGIQPNVELAQAAGLKVDNGIVVDDLLRTSAPDIYAAGDVANFYNPDLDKRMRIEHADNADSMGKAAGRIMAGSSNPYHYLPFFYSDLFDLGYEAVGELDSRLETVSDWQEPYRKGVVYYLRDKKVRGVLLWNVWDQIEAARQVIRSPQPVQANDLKNRLPA